MAEAEEGVGVVPVEGAVTAEGGGIKGRRRVRGSRGPVVPPRLSGGASFFLGAGQFPIPHGSLPAELPSAKVAGDSVRSDWPPPFVPPLLPPLRLPGGGGNWQRAPAFLRGDELRSSVTGPTTFTPPSHVFSFACPTASFAPPSCLFGAITREWVQKRERHIFACRSGYDAKWVGDLSKLLELKMKTQR